MSDRSFVGETIALPQADVHMVGTEVAVRWKVREETKKSTEVLDGQPVLVTRTRRVRRGAPYIDFVWLREDRLTGEIYEDDDSPAQGGLSPEFATSLARQLDEAVRYIHTLQP